MKAISYSFPCAVVALGFLNATVQGQTPLSNAWTYQGHLEQGGSPVEGTCDFEFSLWNDSDLELLENQVGNPVSFTGIDVSGGGRCCLLACSRLHGPCAITA